MGVSKASGLAQVAAELGVDAADVLAIGDGRNDIEMLRWAGRGVAMGQAIEVVREAADAVTGTVYDEGAATELDRWFGPAPSSMSLPRLVATDLDGTLLRSDGSVSPHTAAVLRGVLDRGVEVAFVTARPWRWMTDLWAYVGSRGLAVVSNGALLLDVATGEPLEVHGIDAGGRTAPGRRDPGARAGVRSSRSRCWPASSWTPTTASPATRRPAARAATWPSVWTEPGAQAPGPPPDPGSRSSSATGVLDAVGDRATATWTDGRADGDQRGRGDQGRGAGPAVRAAGGRRRATWWRSGTCPTTCRCWPGPARRTPSRTRTPRCSRRPTTSPRRTTTTGWPRCSPRFSGCDVMCR